MPQLHSNSPMMRSRNWTILKVYAVLYQKHLLIGPKDSLINFFGNAVTTFKWTNDAKQKLDYIECVHRIAFFWMLWSEDGLCCLYFIHSIWIDEASSCSLFFIQKKWRWLKDEHVMVEILKFLMIYYPIGCY